MPSIQNPEVALTLGSLDLIGGDKSGPFWFETLGEDASWGNPEAIQREIESFLQDGAIVAVDSYGNREMTLRVMVCAEDSPGLAAGELALMAELRKRNVLTWTPPNVLSTMGDPCVFDIVHSEPAGAFDDMLEIQALQRGYTLTIQALPHARSAVARTTLLEAPSGASPTVTSITDCTSTTGWTIETRTSGTSSLTSSGGSVRGKWTNSTSNTAQPDSFVLLTYTPSSPINMSASPYLRVQYGVGGWRNTSPLRAWIAINPAAGDGIPSQAPTAVDGSTAWFAMPAGMTNLNYVTVAVEGGLEATYTANMTMRVDDLSRSDIPQNPAGTRQIFGTVDVAGSVRTEARIAVEDETSTALGTVLVYTAPNVGAVAQPPLRSRLVAGPTETTDTSLISGKYSDLSTTHSFDTPVAQVPDGIYLLMARVKHASAATYALTWAARSRMGSVDLSSSLTGVQSVTLAAGVWTTVTVATFPLPLRTTGEAGIVRVDLSSVSGVLLDEAWLFNMTTGALTQVECGSAAPSVGGTSSRLWLTPPSLQSPVAQVARGTLPEGEDSYAPTGSLGSFDAHEFVPPSMSMFVATSNSVAMKVSGEYFPRFFTHVVEDPA